MAAALLYRWGYLYGGWAGTASLLRKRAAGWIGAFVGVAALLTTALLASWVGFLQEGTNAMGTFDDPFLDYIAKPLFWVRLVGLRPAVVVGL